MKKDEIKSKVESVFRLVFGNDIFLGDETSASDIRAWDSLKHVILINEIELEFDIAFEIDEMLDMQSFGSICNCVYSKLNS